MDQIKLMINDGATIIDIGGESTRPGSQTITEAIEWSRINTIITEFKKNFPKAILSLDTRKSQVMINGIKNGVDIINDVSGLNFDKKSFDVVKSKRNPLILPKLKIREKPFWKLEFEDFELHNYEHHPIIKFPVAV